jgi:ABC-type branched-subunit amino acid transport system permease subunit
MDHAPVLRPPLTHPLPLLASNAAFVAIFAVFVVALVTLIVIVLMWAIRRDRAGRAAWLQRQQNKAAPAEGEIPPASRP